jgi:integrin beta 8
MPLPSSAPITLSAIQTEFGAGSLSAAATAAGVSANMLAFLGQSSFTPTVYDYVTPGFYTWVKPSGCNNIEAICVAGGAAGGGTDGYGEGGGGGAGQAYYFYVAVAGNINILVGAGAVGRVNGQGYDGTNSSMSIGVTCLGGKGGFPGEITGGADGGASGNGNSGGVGNPAGDTSPSSGGGGGTLTAGHAYWETSVGGYGGSGATYTLNSGVNGSYYVGLGGASGYWYYTSVTGYAGGGGRGAPGFSYNAAGESGANGRVIFRGVP